MTSLGHTQTPSLKVVEINFFEFFSQFCEGGVVVVPPSFDNNLGFPQQIEDFAVQQFIAHSPVEAFTVFVLPGRSRLDVDDLCPS
mgnify:CR=1 FL=1